MRCTKVLPAALLALALLCPAACGAQAPEDFRFVDAHEATGYYVDMGSIQPTGETELEARVAVIKANLNRMYVYRMRFDHGQGTYWILGSEVRAYDTQEILETAGPADEARPYGPSSMMQEMVAYILHPETR